MRDRINQPWLWVLAIALSILVSLIRPAYAAAPSCYPWQLTSAGFEQTNQPTNVVKWLSIDGAQASFVVTYYCDQRYGWSANYFYGYRRELTPSWQSILASLPTMPKADVDALWLANSGTPDPKLEAIAARQLDATRPPAILWKVRPNGTQTSRPVFFLNPNGTRNTTVPNNLRVQVGSICQCTVKAIEEPISGSDSSNTYCEIGGLDNVVTPFPDALAKGLVSLCVRS